MATAGIWQAQAFWLPKKGHEAEEYEDAWAVELERGCFAVADGATESSFAGEWARLLTADFAAKAGADPVPWLERVPELGSRWWAAVADRPLPWYGETKREEGAFATFLGLVLTEESAWRALAVGDCCLFHVRAGAVLAHFPMDKPEEFGSNPWLLGSRRVLTSEMRQRALATTQGDWASGDEFWLLTDAVACWLLTGMRNEPDRPVVMPFAASAAGFAAWIAAERAAGAMRNDDCTWLVVTTE
jgi:hypothetical protein